MDESQIATAFLNLNETPILIGCARSLGRGFTIVSGLVRNLLLRVASANDLHPLPSSLFELVDPLSDIDLVVDDPDDADRLLSLIGSALPVARFFRWEVKALATRRKESTGFEKIGVDRIEIEISSGKDVAPKLKGLDVSVGATLDELTRKVVSLPPVDEIDGGLLQVLITLLKGTRYSTYAADLDAPGIPSYERRLNDYRRRNTDTRLPSAVDQFRIAIQVLDLLLTAHSLPTALVVLKRTLSALPDQYFTTKGRSQLLSQVRRFVDSDPNSYRDEYLSVRVLPSGNRKLPNVELQTEKGADGGGTSWVTVPRVPGRDGSECCYRDFSLGAALIAWRRLSNSPVPETKDLAVKARLVGEAGYSIQNKERFIALPAVASSGVSNVVRIDHGYVYAVANGPEQLEMALFTING